MGLLQQSESSFEERARAACTAAGTRGGTRSFINVSQVWHNSWGLISENRMPVLSGGGLLSIYRDAARDSPWPKAGSNLDR